MRVLTLATSMLYNFLTACLIIGLFARLSTIKTKVLLSSIFFMADSVVRGYLIKAYWSNLREEKPNTQLNMLTPMDTYQTELRKRNWSEFSCTHGTKIPHMSVNDKCDTEIKKIIALFEDTFTKMKSIFTNRNIKVYTKINTLKAYIYGPSFYRDVNAGHWHKT